MVQVRRMCPFTLQNIAKKGSWPSSAKSDAAADDCHVYRQPMKNLDVIVFCCFRGKAKAIWKKTPPCSAELIVKADCWATSLHESLIITLFTLSVDLICSLLADFSALLRLYSVWLTDFHRCEVFFFFHLNTLPDFPRQHVLGEVSTGPRQQLIALFFLIEASTSEITPSLGSHAKLAFACFNLTGGIPMQRSDFTFCLFCQWNGGLSACRFNWPFNLMRGNPIDSQSLFAKESRPRQCHDSSTFKHNRFKTTQEPIGKSWASCLNKTKTSHQRKRQWLVDKLHWRSCYTIQPI